MRILIRRALLGAAALSLLGPRAASATWSIIVLDRASGEVGVAGASCTPDVFGILRIVPGKGALVAQAIGHEPGARRALELLGQDAPLDSVLRSITDPAFDPEAQQRQYAMASFAGGQAQFTGAATGPQHGHRAAPGVLVQGNLLPEPAVLDRILAAVQRARDAGRSLDQVLMEGLRAGSDAGGDVRCGAQRATSAFLVVARPGDRAHLPFLTLSVFGVDRGETNAVEVLESRLAHWHAGGGPRHRVTHEGVRPGSP